MFRIYKIMFIISNAIAEKSTNIANISYDKYNTILEKQYSKDVTNFYENGKGYYGR